MLGAQCSSVDGWGLETRKRNARVKHPPGHDKMSEVRRREKVQNRVGHLPQQ